MEFGLDVTTGRAVVGPRTFPSPGRDPHIQLSGIQRARTIGSFEASGDIPAAELEDAYYRHASSLTEAAIKT